MRRTLYAGVKVPVTARDFRKMRKIKLLLPH